VYAKFCRIRQQQRVSHWYQQVCDLLKLLVLPHVACRSDERSRFIMFCIFIDLSPAQGSFRYTEAADTNTYSHALQHQEIISRVTSSLTDFTCSSANRHLKPQVSHIRAPTISPSLISLSLPPAHTPSTTGHPPPRPTHSTTKHTYHSIINMPIVWSPENEARLLAGLFKVCEIKVSGAQLKELAAIIGPGTKTPSSPPR
jgi:hypothetical protein